ncbi:hypothetical protein CATMIT_02545 [Catenibacterium mitsuokai DSM 15897]|uniref:hypothetical protein n=1 Tax=Catenibacterium mitsuokai TaxID=100886 RepID=UPI000196CFB4|nr:hypothetical protein [Catenibacterium mitsuokai]EEF92847.1 hypothetical protein CATMIT_02545 [Catenibacterium mitsuokai DSM 15897]UWO52651.1 hypothetical protein NQ499_10375 [Catenibacterium mitsuokai]
MKNTILTYLLILLFKGRLGVNAMKAKRHLYDHVVSDVVDSYKSLLDIITK